MDPNIIWQSLAGLVTTPQLIGLMLLAIPVGILFGYVPGLGGKLGIVLMLPFVYGMDPLPGCVFLLSVHAVVHTGGIVPSILFGVPTNGPEAPLLVDGTPMARSGQAGRALGAGLGAAAIGGVVGVICLAALLPVVEPLVLAFSPTEFFWLAVMGITFIAALAGPKLVQGLMIGCFGWLLGMVGLDPQTGVQRFTGGQLFLWDGFDVIVGVLSFYALPELMTLGRRRGHGAVEAPPAPVVTTLAQVLDGVWDNVRHWRLTLATSVMGTFIGMVPGLGAEAAGWMNYAFAVSRSRTPERFGKGAVEGVIAPSTGMNAKEGGGLLPTLFFGVPAGSGMAVMLGAFIMLGVKPGPLMIVNDLPLVWSLIWTIALANLLCTGFLVLMGRRLSAISTIRATLLVPVVMVFALLGVYLAKQHWESLLVLGFLAALGTVMRRNDWPRPCFVIGLVLGPTAEQSFHKATALWGLRFLTQPTSLVMMVLIAVTLGVNLRRSRRGAAGLRDAGA